MNSKSVCIYYFSGTGNTEIISYLFCKEFKKHGVSTTIKAIEEVLKGNIPLDGKNYNLFGFGHPVHAFSAPKIFFEFIKRLSPVEKTPSFYFRTSGDPLCNAGATNLVRNILEKKGYDIFHESLLVMPSNVIIDYDDDLVKQLYVTAKRKIAKKVIEILQNEIRLPKQHIWLKIISYLFSKAASIGARYFGKYLYATANCNQCGLCIQNCPTENIYYAIESRKIKFGNNCTFCMRCVYLCPKSCIKNKYMNFFILKDGYNIKPVIKNSKLKGRYITETTKGYFKHFYTYLLDI